jgi:hypothetical protein
MSYDKAFYDAWRPWALELCEEWNMNASIAEIAEQIQLIGKKSDTKEFAVLKDVFNEYFGRNGNPPMMSQFEAITQCVEHLESNE